jgi:hypothetical protein
MFDDEQIHNAGHYWYLHVFEGVSTPGFLFALVRDTVYPASRLIFSPIKSKPILTKVSPL